MNRSIIFWLWNAPLEAGEICKQIRDMHDKHIGGFFIHAMPSEFRPEDFPGGMPGYLSEHFFQMVRIAAECAAKYGMEAWLYDEGGWPSGTVNETLLKEHPELAARFLNAEGKIVYSKNRPDLLNAEVTRIFIESVHEKYRQYAGEYFGKTIPGIFTDEPSFGSVKPGQVVVFSPVLEARFKAEKGYEAKDAAMKILKGNDPRARQDYNEVWVKLIVENYLTPIREWCVKNNLLFTGHFNGDDCVENMQQLLGSDIFSLLNEMDVPGCDAIWRQIHPLMPETDFPRIAASAAGNKPSISETFAVYGTDLSLAEMKYTAAMEFVAGIKMVAPMALHYSNQGGRQITTVSNFSGNDPRWEYFKLYSDFASRMSKVFDRTVPVIKVSVPYDRKGLQRGELDGSVYGKELFRRGLALAARQITYDYQPDVPEFSGNIIPDIELETPVPQLRTRLLKSPRGERRILVNAGMETIKLKFKAPAGFNAWYDPADGKRTTAAGDEEGMLSWELPFGGCMVLLTIPGNNRQAAAPETAFPVLPLDFKFSKIVRQIKSSPAGFIEVTPEKMPGENFCGTRRYSCTVELSESRRVTVALPQALRAMCSLRVNGKAAGVRVWQPYSWTELELPAGISTLELDISGTPHPAITTPEHLEFLHANNFDNVYFQRCMKFEPIFPDENPLSGAIMIG